MSRIALLLSLAKGPVGCSRRKSQCVQLCKNNYKEWFYNVVLPSLQIYYVLIYVILCISLDIK